VVVPGRRIPVKQSEKQPTEGEKSGHERLTALIGRHLLRTLGQPDDLLCVQVRRLWEDHYRANVFLRADVSARIARSYFLVTDRDGNIMQSTPGLTRLA
jgi:hypothetical protein